MMERILSIETSCDETSVAILEVNGARVELPYHETATQILTHRKTGGVVPEVAARMHVSEIIELLDRSGFFTSKKKFDAIAVTQGPGLPTALRVGITAARALASQKDIPLIGVNHLEGHLASAWLIPENRRQWKFPLLAVLVSGGHSEFVIMKDFCSYRVVGRTRDDAAGEAFDKTAKMIGLPYPGGPEISKLATKGDPKAFDFPRPMMKDASFDMSFSGLKTAVRQTWEKMSKSEQQDEKIRANLAASIQEAIVDVTTEKARRVMRTHQPKSVTLVGGVSANRALQDRLREVCESEDVPMLAPATGFHTDNAAMIATAGLWKLRAKKFTNWTTMEAKPEWDL